MMSNCKYDHARELFSDAVEILVTSEKDLQHRLYEVYERIYHLHHTELPNELLKDYLEIESILEKIKVHYISPELSIPEKKLNIRNKTGIRVAHIIWNIYYELHFNDKY